MRNGKFVLWLMSCSCLEGANLFSEGVMANDLDTGLFVTPSSRFFYEENGAKGSHGRVSKWALHHELFVPNRREQQHSR